MRAIRRYKHGLAFSLMNDKRFDFVLFGESFDVVLVEVHLLTVDGISFVW